MHKFVPKTVMEENPHYDPEALLETLQSLLGAKNDRQLAVRLGVQPSQICKIQKRRLAMSPNLLISMHEETNMSLRQLRALMGDYRNTGPTAKHPVQPPRHLIGTRASPGGQATSHTAAVAAMQ